MTNRHKILLSIIAILAASAFFTFAVVSSLKQKSQKLVVGSHIYTFYDGYGHYRIYQEDGSIEELVVPLEKEESTYVCFDIVAPEKPYEIYKD